jgi:hypothetical protein
MATRQKSQSFRNDRARLQPGGGVCASTRRRELDMGRAFGALRADARLQIVEPRLFIQNSLGFVEDGTGFLGRIAYGG